MSVTVSDMTRDRFSHLTPQYAPRHPPLADARRKGGTAQAKRRYSSLFAINRLPNHSLLFPTTTTTRGLEFGGPRRDPHAFVKRWRYTYIYNIKNPLKNDRKQTVIFQMTVCSFCHFKMSNKSETDISAASQTNRLTPLSEMMEDDVIFIKDSQGRLLFYKYFNINLTITLVSQPSTAPNSPKEDEESGDLEMDIVKDSEEEENIEEVKNKKNKNNKKNKIEIEKRKRNKSGTDGNSLSSTTTTPTKKKNRKEESESDEDEKSDESDSDSDSSG